MEIFKKLDDKADASLGCFRLGSEQVFLKGSVLILKSCRPDAAKNFRKKGFDIVGVTSQRFKVSLKIPEIFVGGIPCEFSFAFDVRVKEESDWTETERRDFAEFIRNRLERPFTVEMLQKEILSGNGGQFKDYVIAAFADRKNNTQGEIDKDAISYEIVSRNLPSWLVVENIYPPSLVSHDEKQKAEVDAFNRSIQSGLFEELKKNQTAEFVSKKRINAVKRFFETLELPVYAIGCVGALLQRALKWTRKKVLYFCMWSILGSSVLCGVVYIAGLINQFMPVNVMISIDGRRHDMDFCAKLVTELESLDSAQTPKYADDSIEVEYESISRSSAKKVHDALRKWVRTKPYNDYVLLDDGGHVKKDGELGFKMFVKTMRFRVTVSLPPIAVSVCGEDTSLDDEILRILPHKRSPIFTTDTNGVRGVICDLTDAELEKTIEKIKKNKRLKHAYTNRKHDVHRTLGIIVLPEPELIRAIEQTQEIRRQIESRKELMKKTFTGDWIKDAEVRGVCFNGHINTYMAEINEGERLCQGKKLESQKAAYMHFAKALEQLDWIKDNASLLIAARKVKVCFEKGNYFDNLYSDAQKLVVQADKETEDGLYREAKCNYERALSLAKATREKLLVAQRQKEEAQQKAIEERRRQEEIIRKAKQEAELTRLKKCVADKMTASVEYKGVNYIRAQKLYTAIDFDFTLMTFEKKKERYAEIIHLLDCAKVEFEQNEELKRLNQNIVNEFDQYARYKGANYNNAVRLYNQIRNDSSSMTFEKKKDHYKKILALLQKGDFGIITKEPVVHGGEKRPDPSEPWKLPEHEPIYIRR